MTDKDLDDLMELFNAPQDSGVRTDKEPTRCGLCGISGLKLYPYAAGMMNLYVCGFCRSMLNERRENH